MVQINNLTTTKDSYIVLILTVVTLIIIIIGFLYYFYYRGLKKRECNKITSIYGTLNGKISSIDTSLEQYQYTFKDYYIKSAYNACSGGSYKNDFVDICILKNIIKQGVRGLDFEIFSIDNQPVVATSTSDSFYVKETFNYIPFSEIMTIIRDYAFSSSTAPNFMDPIIIHLRIKSANKDMYNNFANILESYGNILLGKEYSYEYQGKNLGNVKLADFMGKVIIIVDRSNTSFLESEAFYEYVNMTSNSVFMKALHYYDIKYAPDINELIETNKTGMTIALPDKGANPENPSAVVLRETGCQLLAMRYQEVDVNIEENDIFFDQNGHAFVLKPENLRYVQVTIPAPPNQDPKLSYATRTVKSDYYKFEI
jgi:hypothetical protein